MYTSKRQKKKLGKLQVWNNDISNPYKEMKQTNINWCNAGKPKGNHPLVEQSFAHSQYRNLYILGNDLKHLLLSHP
jgi:hypothetical protein